MIHFIHIQKTETIHIQKTETIIMQVALMM